MHSQANTGKTHLLLDPGVHQKYVCNTYRCIKIYRYQRTKENLLQFLYYTCLTLSFFLFNFILTYLQTRIYTGHNSYFLLHPATATSSDISCKEHISMFGCYLLQDSPGVKITGDYSAQCKSYLLACLQFAHVNYLVNAKSTLTAQVQERFCVSL